MANVRELKGRIKAVQKTKQITRAMKMVATVRYKRALETFHQAKPYLQGIESLKQQAFRLPEASAHPLFQRRPEHRLAIVVVGSDKGLCGSYNSNLFRFTLRKIAQEIESGKNVELITIGRRGKDFFKRLPYPLAGSSVNVQPTMAQAKILADQWANWFISGRFDQVVIAHNRFKNVTQCFPMFTGLFPLTHEGEAEETPFDVLFEPGREAVAEKVISTVPEALVYGILMESTMAEQGIRMTMMDQATTKADDLTKEISIRMNKERQASITRELIEMTAAAASLK